MIDKVFPKIHNEGYKFLVIFGLATLILNFINGFLGFVGLVLTIWVYYFFRDPERISIEDENYLMLPLIKQVKKMKENTTKFKIALEKILL